MEKDNVKSMENASATETMESIENMEDMNDIEEEAVLSKELEMMIKGYQNRIADSNSRCVGLRKEEPERIMQESDVAVWAEAEIVPLFSVKAFQNKGALSSLTWDTVGNKSNENLSGAVWDRVGVSCSTVVDDHHTGAINICNDESTLMKSSEAGTNYFKTIMVRTDYNVVVPAYSTVRLKVSMNLHFFKRGGETSSTYIGGVLSHIDSWTIATKSRKNDWADNNGVVQSANSEDCTKASSNSKNYEMRLGINGYDCGEQTNQSDSAKLWKVTFYFMCAIEQASTIHHRLMMFDRKNDVWETELTGTSTIYYDPNGGQMEKTQQIREYSPNVNYHATNLFTASRQGYILTGWYDRIADRYYAPGGIFDENRGVKLIAQWMPGQASYTVNHFFQNIDGSYAKQPDTVEQHTGTTDETVTVAVMERDGFISPPVNNVVIHGDGSTAINYYYARKIYTVTFLANGGMFRGGGDFAQQEAVYGISGDQIIYPKVEPRDGYSFKWSETLSVMPAYDVTVRVIWTRNVNQQEVV